MYIAKKILKIFFFPTTQEVHSLHESCLYIGVKVNRTARLIATLLHKKTNKISLSSTPLPHKLFQAGRTPLGQDVQQKQTPVPPPPNHAFTAWKQQTGSSSALVMISAPR